MAVRITGPVQPGNVGRPSGRTTAKKTEEAAGESGGHGEKVDLSEKDSALSAARQASAGTPEVDEAKIAALRAAIASGDYNPDLRVVAERIIAEALVFARNG